MPIKVDKKFETQVLAVLAKYGLFNMSQDIETQQWFKDSIHNGLQKFEDGDRGIPAEQVFKELRKKHGLPSKI